MQMEWHFAQMELVVVKPVGATALQVDLQQDGSPKLVGVQFMDLSKGKQPFMLARRSSKNDPSTFVC